MSDISISPNVWISKCHCLCSPIVKSPKVTKKGYTIFGEMTFGDQTFGEMTFGERLLLFQTYGDLDFW